MFFEPIKRNLLFWLSLSRVEVFLKWINLIGHFSLFWKFVLLKFIILRIAFTIIFLTKENQNDTENKCYSLPYKWLCFWVICCTGKRGRRCWSYQGFFPTQNFPFAKIFFLGFEDVSFLFHFIFWCPSVAFYPPTPRFNWWIVRRSFYFFDLKGLRVHQSFELRFISEVRLRKKLRTLNGWEFLILFRQQLLRLWSQVWGAAFLWRSSRFSTFLD